MRVRGTQGGRRAAEHRYEEREYEVEVPRVILEYRVLSPVQRRHFDAQDEGTLVPHQLLETNEDRRELIRTMTLD
ncbi:MAG: hypothetical protein ACO3JL_20335, partial [Myxococcota bacterium]